MYLQRMRVPLLDDPTVGDAASTDMTAIVWVIVWMKLCLHKPVIVCLIYMRGHCEGHE